MGAVFNIDESVGRTMRDAYRNAVEDAIYEYGHDSYNGTISTTEGYLDKTELFNQMGKEAFEEYAVETTQKWGDAWGIRIGQREGSEFSHYKFYYWGAV